MGGTVTLKEQWHLARKYGSFEKSITAIFRTDDFTSQRCDSFSRAFFGSCNIKESVCCNSCQSCIYSCYGCSAGQGLVQCLLASELWHLKLPTQECFIATVSSANFSLRWKGLSKSALPMAVQHYLLTGTPQPLFSLTSKSPRSHLLPRLLQDAYVSVRAVLGNSS